MCALQRIRTWAASPAHGILTTATLGSPSMPGGGPSAASSLYSGIFDTNEGAPAPSTSSQAPGEHQAKEAAGDELSNESAAPARPQGSA